MEIEPETPAWRSPQLLPVPPTLDIMGYILLLNLWHGSIAIAMNYEMLELLCMPSFKYFKVLYFGDFIWGHLSLCRDVSWKTIHDILFISEIVEYGYKDFVVVFFYCHGQIRFSNCSQQPIIRCEEMHWVYSFCFLNPLLHLNRSLHQAFIKTSKKMGRKRR